MDTSLYDGFTFLPCIEKDNSVATKFSFFEFTENKFKGEPVGKSPIGYSYHVALFKVIQNSWKMTDNFDAIFVDPYVYALGLCDHGMYGCIVKQTTKSRNWFDQKLENVIQALSNNEEENDE